MRAALRIESTNSLFIQRQTHTYLSRLLNPSLLTAQSVLKYTSTIFPPIKPYIFLKVIKEMDGFDWDNTNAVIGELIPLPPCLQSNFSGEFDNSSECYAHIDEEFGIEESLPHAILDLHKLEPTNKNLKIDEVTSSSATGCDTDSIDSKPLSEYQESKLVMRNENTLSPQSCQANIFNPSPKQTHIFLECTRNPNIHKRCRKINTPDFPKQTFIAPNPSHRPKRFEIVFENTCRPKRPKIQGAVNLASISFSNKSSAGWELDEEAMAEVKEIVYMQAAMQPVNLALEELTEKPKRKNVRISSDPQTVAARHRREKISERLRVLQRLVPGGSKLDTASMLDEAASYVKFLQSLVRGLENLDPTVCNMISAIANPIETTLPPPQTKP